MLRRNNSNRLSRSKSTSSVRSKHDSIDPEVARHHAHTAATLAFARAQERSSTDMSHSGGLSRSNTGNRNPRDHQPLSQQTNNIQSDQVIRRQQSVRFVGPNAVQRRHSIGTRAGTTLQPKASSATLRPMAMTTSAPVPAAYRPPSRSSSIGKASLSKGTAASFITANAFDEYYTREDDIASTPSSYRRIRKSKSMFSPLKAPSVFYTNGTPERPESSWTGGQYSVSNSQTPQSQPPRARLRAPKSMSFLRGRRDQAAPGERNDAAVQLARDRFFHETAQQRLREQPSFLFRSKAQRQEKPFRKSVRSGSGNSLGNAVASSNQIQAPKEYSLKDAARKASKSFKKTLRRVFGRSKDESVAVPNQQVDARETHVRGHNCDPCSTHETFVNIPRPDEAAMSRVASRIPSIHRAGSNQQLRSQNGSVKSSKSITSLSDHGDDKSRATSWNSTGVNTIASQNTKIQHEREQHRLSIINENGSHVASSSFTRPRISNQFSAYPTLHPPNKSAGHSPSQLPGPVDSARVYSALMKRLDENSPKTRLESSRKASLESVGNPTQIPVRSSSVNSSRGNRTPATIRQVYPEDSSNGSQSRQSSGHDHYWVRADSIKSAKAEDIFGYTGEHVHQWMVADSLRESREADDVFSPNSASKNKENIPIRRHQSQIQNTSPLALSRQTSTKTSYHTVPESFGLTPQEIALRNEPIIPSNRGLREARSTFFGGTTHTIARTTSPFRRAMEEGSYSNSVSDKAIPTRLSQLRNPLYLGPDSAIILDRDQSSEKNYSDSEYSRTTSGQNPATGISAVSPSPNEAKMPEMPFKNTGTGAAVILERATYRPALSNPNAHRLTSSAGSTEWKTWMSSEVAKLERAKENHNPAPYVNYALPTMPKSFHAGHVRESAQISDDSVEIAQRKVSGVKQPLRMVQQQQSNVPTLRPILKKPSTVSLVENMEPGPSTSKIPIPPPPPLPNPSPLRPVRSNPSPHSAGHDVIAYTTNASNSAVKISSLSGKNLLHKRNGSQSTLRSTKSTNASIKSLETPAKLVKRHGRPGTAHATPSPGGGLTAEKQYGSSSTHSRYRTPGMMASKENLRVDVSNRSCKEIGRDEEEDIYGIKGTGLLGPRMSVTESDAQAMGSKQMVDLFLSSRRRRIAGGSEDSGAVFL